MRIAVVLKSNFFLNKGGAEYQAYLISKYLSSCGHEVHYIYEGKKIKNRDGILYHNLPRRSSPIQMSEVNYSKLKAILDDVNPDLVYQRCRNAYTGLIGRYRRIRDIKFVWAAASNMDVDDKIHVRNLNDFRRSLSRPMTIRGIRSADKIIVQTKFQMGAIKKAFKLDSTLIPNSHEVPNPPFIKDDTPIICWIANIKDFRKLEDFLNLADTCRDLEAKFVIVGRPSIGSYQEILERRIQSLDNVSYLGELSFEEVNDLISQSSIFVHTSLIEGFPNTYIQAWMREVPVVSIHFDPDQIMVNNGFGYHSKNCRQLRKDVRRLYMNKELRMKMGKKARKYAVENFDISQVGKKYESLFLELINE